MSKRFSYLAGLVPAVMMLFLHSCKEDTIVKAGITPGNDQIGLIKVPDNFFDIITKTAFIDTLNTGDNISGVRVIHGAGTVVDPYFGKTNEGIYFQVLPPSVGFVFSKQYTMDSAVVVLPYTGFSWGDTLNPAQQRFSLYELTESISVDSTYYSFNTKTVNRAQPLASNVTVDISQLRKAARATVSSDSMLINGARVPAHLRFPLDVTDPNGFVKRLENDIANNRTIFSSNPNFIEAYKGFYVEPDTNQTSNTLPYFFLDGTVDYGRAALVLYFRENDNPSVVKTAFFSFDREDCAHFNWISRNYNGTPAKTIIDNYKSTIDVSDPTILMQNEPGPVLDLRIKKLDQLPVAIVNKAEIVITKISTGNIYADSTFTSPIRLDPFGVNDDGTLYEIEDRNYSSLAAAIEFIGGTQRSITVNGVTVTQYTFNIPREVQKAIKDKREELHLRIVGAKGFPGAYRLVAGGRTHGTYNVQLNVVYSKPQ